MNVAAVAAGLTLFAGECRDTSDTTDKPASTAPDAKTNAIRGATGNLVRAMNSTPGKAIGVFNVSDDQLGEPERECAKTCTPDAAPIL